MLTYDNNKVGKFCLIAIFELDLIAGDETTFEAEPMRTLADQGELAVYKHDGFWQCMDTYREMELLNKLDDSGKAPWKVWQ